MQSLHYLLSHTDVAFNDFSGSLKVVNPFDNHVLAYVRMTQPETLPTIIERAQVAQKQWAAQTALVRADSLWAWYHAVLAKRDDLARLLTLEQGKSLTEARGEIDYAASFIRWFAEEARRIDGDVFTATGPNQKLLMIKQPIGVTAAITPWNFPAAMITRKVAPALASGCAIIVKPASKTPLSAYALAQLAYENGIPHDLMPIVCGQAADISAVLATSEVVRKISFTGSTEVGAEIYRNSAANIKKLSLELGGNAPVLVFDDADLAQAVKGVMDSKFRNSGQTCVCANRIYVQSGIYDVFCTKLAEAIGQLKLGNGLEEGVQQGPLIDEQAVSKVEQHCADALAKGASCLVGGQRSVLGGTFFEPTLMRDCNSEMLCAREETFGPFCPIFKFETEDEAIAAANHTEFGLASYLFTQNASRQWRVAEALEYGMVGINTGLISNTVAPFGGMKASGLGREGSRYGIDEYMEMKYLCVNLG